MEEFHDEHEESEGWKNMKTVGEAIVIGSGGV
ncbi:unnamed protein product, partial [marine sediment metagenome]